MCGYCVYATLWEDWVGFIAWTAFAYFTFMMKTFERPVQAKCKPRA